MLFIKQKIVVFDAPLKWMNPQHRILVKKLNTVSLNYGSYNKYPSTIRKIIIKKLEKWNSEVEGFRFSCTLYIF